MRGRSVGPALDNGETRGVGVQARSLLFHERIATFPVASDEQHFVPESDLVEDVVLAASSGRRLATFFDVQDFILGFLPRSSNGGKIRISGRLRTVNTASR
jgi:hypothetical protein